MNTVYKCLKQKLVVTFFKSVMICNENILLGLSQEHVEV